MPYHPICTPTLIIYFSAQIGNTNDKQARKSIKTVLSKCYLGDWFVLFQLSKNFNMYFFRTFVKKLANHPQFKSQDVVDLESNETEAPKVLHENHLTTKKRVKVTQL